jgi:UDP:flavonoid glycosyltransferase YjiC (YdhE family)
MPLFSLDQRLNAEHVEVAGAGLTLWRGAEDVGRIPEAVRTLLAGTSHREAAREVAAQIAQLPPVAQMVPVLEEVAAGGGVGPVLSA